MNRSIPSLQRPTSGDPFALNQASALPYKVTRDGLMICLITSRKKQRWGFPKASIQGVDKKETARHAAQEKAGVTGKLSTSPVGRYRRLKYGQICEVSVYGLEVKENMGEWPQSRLRQRKWIEASAAADLLVKPELQDMLERVRRSLSCQLPA